MHWREFKNTLQETELHNLERRERKMIICTWQQIQGIREDILGLKTHKFEETR